MSIVLIVVEICFFFLNFIQLRIINCVGEKENICRLTETKSLLYKR